MAENEVRLDSLPLVRSKDAGGLVDRRNIDPRDLPRQVTLREGSQRLSSTERPRQPGLGGWSDTESACMVGLADYDSIFEFGATGSDNGWTICLEFRLGSLSYTPGTASEFILCRWGGKSQKIHMVITVVVTPGTGSDQTKASLSARLANLTDESTVVWDLTPAPSTTDQVYRVAVGLGSNSSPTPSPERNNLVVRYLNSSGAIASGGAAALTGGVGDGGLWNDTNTADWDSHNDLTILGARPRANVAGETTADGTEGKGPRPVLTNFLLYDEYVLSSDLLDILGKDV